jgi:hypothetical protein
MDQIWVVLIGSIAAGIFALGGAYIGFLGGRRQTADQANVEHGQWLRNQRQEAYVQLLDSWDQAVDALEEIVDHWDELDVNMANHGMEDEFQPEIDKKAGQAWQMTAKPLERVALLGPEPVDAAVLRMESAFDEAEAWLVQQAAPAPAERAWGTRWPELVRGLHSARREFMVAAKEEMGQAPRPGQ